MRSTNPVFTQIKEEYSKNTIIDTSHSATYKGIAAKTITLILITLITGAFSLHLLALFPNFVIGTLSFGGILGFIAVIIGTRSQRFAMPMSILYAAIQGVVYGTLTLLINQVFPGIAFTAILGTVMILLTMMVLYYSGVVKATPTLVKVILGSLIAIIVTSLVTTIISFINPSLISGLSNNYPLAIGITIIMIILGAFMLVLDFANADAVVEAGAPKTTEWQVSLGFMVTLIWIYFQILRLLATIASRND